MPEKLTILFVVGSLGIGGKERQLIELISGLPTERYRCHLLVKSYSAYYIEKIKQTLVSFRSLDQKKFHFYDFLTLAKHINTVKPDIVCSWTNITSHFSLLARVCTGHSYRIINCCIRNAPMQLSANLRLERVLYSLYSCVVANSEAGLRAYSQEGKKGRFVLYNGLDINRVPGCSQDEARNQLHLDTKKIIVVMVASCSKLKDHETLLRAFAKNNNVPGSRDYQLLIVGDGERRVFLETMAGDLGLSSSISFMGRRDDVELILRASDISVLSSTAWFGEGISNAIIESLACGTPVIASGSPGTEEVIDDGQNGYLFPSGDYLSLAQKIQALGENHGIRKRFIENGKRTIAEKFSITGMIRSFEEILGNCDKS